MSKYCQCGGPTKQSGFGMLVFDVCTVCGLEPGPAVSEQVKGIASESPAKRLPGIQLLAEVTARRHFRLGKCNVRTRQAADDTIEVTFSFGHSHACTIIKNRAVSVENERAVIDEIVTQMRLSLQELHRLADKPQGVLSPRGLAAWLPTYNNSTAVCQRPGYSAVIKNFH